MNKQKVFFISFYILISIFVIARMTYFSQWNCFCDDDFYYAKLRPYESIFNPLNPFEDIHGYGYFGYWLLTFLAYSLPNYIFHINPSDFISFQHGIIKGGFIVCTLTMLLMFFKQFYKNKAFQIVIYFSLCTMFFYIGLWANIISLNYSFYRYFLSLLPFGYLMYYLYRHTTVKYKKINKMQLILACFCSYITGMSSEILIYLTLTLFCLIPGYNILTKIFSKKVFKLNFGIDILTIFIVFLTSMVIFTSSQGYRQVSVERGINNIIITLDTVKEYSLLYLKNCFINGWFLWIIFIAVFCFALYYALKRKNNIRKLVFPILFEISLLTVMYSLIVCGKTNYFSTYFIVHENILFLFYFLTTIPLMIFFGYYLQNTKSKKLKLCFAIILLTAASYMLINAKEIQTKYLIPQRAKSYILQKIALYDYYKTQQICLPAEVTSRYFPTISDEYRVFEFKYFIKDIYNLPNILETPLFIDENAVRYFVENGGSFGENELTKLKFQNLNDINFVLKKQDDELSEEEILEKLRQ